MVTSDRAARGVPFGRYVIKRRLGRGGMGEVFLADQLGPLGPVRPVALKRMLPQVAHDKHVADLFLAEMGTAALLNHPNIATVYDFGEVEGVYFLAMEYVDGLPLNEILKKVGALGTAEAIAIVRGTLEALAYAHALKRPGKDVTPVVHSDVSPHNLMISADGAVKLLDFGLARAEAAVLGGPVRGKIGYVAPEQARGAPSDRRFDLYAAGVVLYELIAGRRPFEDEDSERVMELQRARSYARLDHPALAKLVDRALEPDPARRFQAAQEFLDAIASLPGAGRTELAQLVVRAGGARKFEENAEVTSTGMVIDRSALGLEKPATGSITAPAPPKKRPREGSPVRFALAVIGMAMLGGGAVYLVQASQPKTVEVVAAPAPVEPKPIERIEPKPIERIEPKPEPVEPPPPQHEEVNPPVAQKSRELGKRPPRSTGRRPVQPLPDPELPKTQASDPASPPRNDVPSGLGVLSVRSTPWSKVTLDGKSLGEGIVAGKPIPAGKHTLVLTPGNEEYPARTVEIEIKVGVATKVFVDFPTSTVRIDPS